MWKCWSQTHLVMGGEVRDCHAGDQPRRLVQKSERGRSCDGTSECLMSVTRAAIVSAVSMVAAVLAWRWWRRARARAPDAHALGVPVECDGDPNCAANSQLIQCPEKPTQLDRTVLDYLVNQARVVLFIKGPHHEPRCKFSRELLTVLPAVLGVEQLDNIVGTDMLACVDILQDTSLRQALKTYARWPTFPQVWHRGVLVGGLDVVREMVANGDRLQ